MTIRPELFRPAAQPASWLARRFSLGSRDPQGSLSHEPASVSLIPVKTPAPVRAAPTESTSAPAAQSATSGETAMTTHIVLLFTGYFRAQLSVSRGFRAD